MFLSHGGDAWLYYVLPKRSLEWEDSPKRHEVAVRLRSMFTAIGLTSRAGVPGIRRLQTTSGLREFHLLSLSWDYQASPPPNTPPPLAALQQDAFAGFACGQGLTVFGVKLRRQVASTVSLRAYLQELVDNIRGKELDLVTFNPDKATMSEILRRAGGRPPSREEARRMEHWWNGGRGCDATIVIEPDGKSLSCDAWPEGLEFSAMIDFENPQLDPRKGLWLNDIFSVNEGCVCVSVRGSIYPPKSVPALFRHAQRKADSQIAENQVTGDLERAEDHETFEAGKTMEDYFRRAGEPLLQGCSFITVRRNSEAVNDYRDHLLMRWGIENKVVEHRQQEAMEETLPCARPWFRHKPFVQDMSVGTLAASGITSFSHVGDDKGVWAGLALSDMSPVWIDPRGASEQDKSPAMAVVGEPGSGKTFFLQWFGTQAKKGGLPVVFVNPKPDSSLDGFCHAAGGETLRLSGRGLRPGLLDPFRFARDPTVAANIASSHIKAVMDLSPDEIVRVDLGLARAAKAGARCVGEALQQEMIPSETRQNIEWQAEGQGLFALGISNEPLPDLGMINEDAMREGLGSLTLVEFDQSLSLPTSSDVLQHSHDEKLAMAAVRLVCYAARESMWRAGGGVLIVDEAHVLMGSTEGQAILTRMGREGRSQGILPILATQRVHDVMKDKDSTMVSYLGRVLALRMSDKQEVAATMELLRLEPTEDRISFLADAGPIRGERGALGYFRDLQGRVSAIRIGPVPDDIAKLFSTNPLDREEAEPQQRDS